MLESQLARVVGLALLLHLGYSHLQLKPNDVEHVKSLGSGVVIICIHDYSDDHQITWYDNNNIPVTELRSSGGRIYIDDQAGRIKLYVLEIKLYDHGNYTCKATKGGETIEQVSTKLIAYDPIKFKDVPTKQNFALGSNGLIICTVVPTPGSSVSWLFKEGHIEIGGRYVTNESGLVIRNMDFSDSGLYACNAEDNKYGQFISMNITVEVQIPPTLKKEFMMTDGIEGADLLLSCEADGKPLPKYNYSLNGKPLLNSSRVNVDKILGRVFFAPLHRDDEGEITCTAFNDVGVVQSIGLLSVKIPPAIISFEGKLVTEGEDVMLECLVEGRPTPHVVIRKHENNNYRSNGNELRIDSVADDAAGLYICEAHSEIGNTEANTSLLVRIKPRPVHDQPLKFVSWVNQTRNMSCTVEAYPPPTFQWFLYRRELSDNETFRIFNENNTSFLQVTVLYHIQGWIYHIYTCRATNSIGSVDVNIYLKRATSPDEPKVTILAIYPAEVRLGIVAPDDDGGQPVTGLRARVNDTEDVQDFPWSDVIRVKKLKPGTENALFLSSGNVIGFGPDHIVKVFTERTRKPYPNNVLRNESFPYGNHYHLRWEEPIDVGLPLQEYKIKFRRVKVNSSGDIEEPLEDWEPFYVKNTSVLSVELSDLRLYHHYQLEVHAKNELGWSDIPEAFVFKLGDVRLINTSGKNPLHMEGDDFDLPRNGEDIPEESESQPSTQGQQLSAAIITTIACLAVIVFLIVVDISCYYIQGSSVIVRAYKMISKKDKTSKSSNNHKKLLVRDQIYTGKQSRNGHAQRTKDDLVALSPIDGPSGYLQPTLATSTSQITSSNKSEILTSNTGEAGDCFDDDEDDGSVYIA